MRKVTVFVFCALAAAFSPVGEALSQAIDLNKINKIPRYSTMSEADFKAKSKEFSEVPQGDLYLEYSIRLRDGWQKLGLTDDERKAVAKETAPKVTSTDPYDIGNLRDQKIVDDKNNIVRDDSGEEIEPEELEVQDGNMLSKRMQRNRDMVIPKDSDVRLLGPVARYVGPANLLAPSRLEISSMQLNHDITTRNWFLNYILSRNYTLTGMEQVGDNRVDAEYVLIDKGISYVVRTAAVSNGRRMVLVSYFVPEKFWEKEKEFQEMSINSFQFLKPEKTVIDDKKTHGFLDLVKFTYPNAWKLIAPNVYSVDNMTAKLLYSTDAVTLQGEIDINLISTELDTTLMKEVEYIRQDLKKRGLNIGEALDTNTTYTFGSKITFSRVEAYTIKGEKKDYIDYEFWLAIMAEDRYYYIVTMLTPGRSSDFYTWARNTETFGTVIQSLQPQSAGETLDANFLRKVQGTDSGGGAVAPDAKAKEE